ncbi:signal peptidase, endoplasmic reticulum-type [Halogranum gelatinilyticum]|uniref:Signal peptidase, endoplasmic reticulum-type n=1 Tax=Halogranum gelatinilyticum TaxID=660521 RepID=A0A1G9PGB4_9EURY|nr:S26 family signal peptidase [Halogranum gelatinilyticum]SDL97195.1 signal peptidase, endoplasmic reticulum-type [Halogranum gelatinilyticum]
MPPEESLLSRFLHTKSGPLMVLRETLSTVLLVALVGLLLFSVSGLWPPMVAVESGSMQPNMVRGDLVFLTEPGRFAPSAAVGETGIATTESAAAAGSGGTFGVAGSVVVYDTPSHPSPIIHRARFWVDEGENWYDEADKRYISAENCEELLNCPAPNAGFVTKGDANNRYDQANGLAEPVRPAEVRGLARFRIPALGCIRLGFGPNSCFA